jgi:transcriptional regulator with XRE-family HTH domain
VQRVADRIRIVLERTGWSQRKLSTTAGLSPSAVWWILNHPDDAAQTDTVIAIARVAGVSSVWLLTGKGSPDDRDDTSDDDSAYTSVTNRSVGHLAEPVATYEPVRTRIADLPNVVELVERAKELSPTIPQWVWEKLLHMSLQLSAPASPVMLSELSTP